MRGEFRVALMRDVNGPEEGFNLLGAKIRGDEQPTAISRDLGHPPKIWLYDVAKPRIQRCKRVWLKVKSKLGDLVR